MVGTVLFFAVIKGMQHWCVVAASSTQQSQRDLNV